MQRRADLDTIHADVHSHKGDEALREQLPDDLPNAPKTGDDDVSPQLLRLPLCSLQRLYWQHSTRQYCSPCCRGTV